MQEMIVSVVYTMTNNKKPQTTNYQKQSQNKPNQTQFQTPSGSGGSRQRKGSQTERPPEAVKVLY
jgi:hypothetical protein